VWVRFGGGWGGGGGRGTRNVLKTRDVLWSSLLDDSTHDESSRLDDGQRGVLKQVKQTASKTSNNPKDHVKLGAIGRFRVRRAQRKGEDVEKARDDECARALVRVVLEQRCKVCHEGLGRKQ
jgi:hypothetical protein